MLSVREVAGRLGISVSTLRQRVYRAYRANKPIATRVGSQWVFTKTQLTTLKEKQKI